jgi:LysM repeat protein
MTAVLATRPAKPRIHRTQEHFRIGDVVPRPSAEQRMAQLRATRLHADYEAEASESASASSSAASSSSASSSAVARSSVARSAESRSAESPSAQLAGNVPITSVPVTRVPVANVPVTRLRITRRGRAVLATLASLPVVAVIVAVAIFGPSNAVATGAVGVDAFDYVTVAAGETLWGIAEELAPSADPRDVISSIVSLNQLQSSTVQPGQRLAIPATYSH